MALEVELKYGADGPVALEWLARAEAIGPAMLGPVDAADELDRYLDTPDGRFAAARWAVRLRRRRGATRLSLKGPPSAGTGGSLHRRPEIEGSATDALDPAAWQPSEARDLVERLRDGARLVERLRLRQSRRERPVVVDDDRLGTLTLDVVRVEAGGRERGTLHAVELELAPGATAAHEALLGSLDAALRRVEGVHPDDRTKLEHALDLIEGR